jgi:hypothetical protein
MTGRYDCDELGARRLQNLSKFKMSATAPSPKFRQAKNNLHLRLRNYWLFRALTQTYHPDLIKKQLAIAG